MKRPVAAVTLAMLATFAAAWFWWSVAVVADRDSSAVAPSSRTAVVAPTQPPDAPVPSPSTAERDEKKLAAAKSVADKWATLEKGGSEVERLCPWPPQADTWERLSAECLAATEQFHVLIDDGLHGFGDEPALVQGLADPMGTRHAVMAALDDPRCSVPVPTGERRPDLREVCGADAMVRFATMLRWCTNAPSETALEVGYWRNRVAASESQDEYYERLERLNRARAVGYWSVHRCRAVPPDALAPLDRLPDHRPVAQANLLWRIAWSLGGDSHYGSFLENPTSPRFSYIMREVIVDRSASGDTAESDR